MVKKKATTLLRNNRKNNNQNALKRKEKLENWRESMFMLKLANNCIQMVFLNTQEKLVCICLLFN